MRPFIPSSEIEEDTEGYLTHTTDRGFFAFEVGAHDEGEARVRCLACGGDLNPALPLLAAGFGVIPGPDPEQPVLVKLRCGPGARG